MTYGYRIATIFLIGFFIDCLNIFMSTIALPNIAAEMHISTSSVSWVINSYILGLTLIIPLSTWLAGRFGSRKIMTASMIIFSISAGFCGLSQNFSTLIIWRFIQGIGGGLLIPVGQALTFSLFKGRKRAKISTLIMSIALIAPALSPTIGGAIVDNFNWRWVFFSNIPFGVIAAILSYLWIKNERNTIHKPDLLGLALVSLILGSLLLSMSFFGSYLSLFIPISFLILGFVFVFLYFSHFKLTPNAIIDLSLFANPKLKFSIWVYLAVPGVFTGVNILNIFYLQQVLHYSAKKTGTFMILYAVGALSAMIICGKLYNRLGAIKLFSCGLLLHSIGIAVLTQINTASDLPLLIIAYVLMGAGGGIAANTAQTTALLDFDGETLSKGSVIWNINRQVSFGIGTVLFTMLFSLIHKYITTISAYHLTFLIASIISITPLAKLRIIR